MREGERLGYKRFWQVQTMARADKRWPLAGKKDKLALQESTTMLSRETRLYSEPEH
jgi:hypothetical protein